MLVALVLAGVAGLALGRLQRSEPVSITDLPTPNPADSAACKQLADALPATIGDGLKPRTVHPSTPLVHAWGTPGVVLRCGVGYPPDYTTTSLTGTVDGVFWYPTETKDAVIYTTVQRTPRVSLAVPRKYAQSFDLLSSLATAITRTTYGT